MQVPLLGKVRKPVYVSNSVKKAPSSVGAHIDAPTPWSHVYILMKSGDFSKSTLNAVLIRGVEFMVRRLVEVADPAAEALRCIQQIELQVKLGNILDSSEITSALRRQIVARNPKRTRANGVSSQSPVAPAVSACLVALSPVERAAARMYYVETFHEHSICSQLSITPRAFRATLGKLRSLNCSLAATKPTDSAIVAG
jgi:hypothetical protein